MMDLICAVAWFITAIMYALGYMPHKFILALVPLLLSVMFFKKYMGW